MARQGSESMDDTDLDDRTRAQLAFLREADRLKHVERANPLIDGSRRENSAEHSWHMTLLSLVLAERSADAVATAQAAADALGVEVGQIANSLIFSADGEPLLVLTSGAHRVATLAVSTRWAPEVSTSSGSPSAEKISELAIWPTVTPSASAAA